VEIAKAITSNAQIVLMDEPTSSISQSDADKLMNIIRGLRDDGVTIIYISHRLHEIDGIADRIIEKMESSDKGDRDFVFWGGMALCGGIRANPKSLTPEFITKIETASANPDCSSRACKIMLMVYQRCLSASSDEQVSALAQGGLFAKMRTISRIEKMRSWALDDRGSDSDAVFESLDRIVATAEERSADRSGPDTNDNGRIAGGRSNSKTTRKRQIDFRFY